ncbi:MAG: CoA-disulfide reductase [Actinobacteria bacterium]|uniref:Unannotated protein n=1 Tax=freshwater metagenome TaxID=449393 RepID=A0A6J7PYU2_9ZZZZ|nr:CoA-disulfide reductase [Actinomycetota bacterium]MSZ45832.1 CoA-disulfide reductase [Actinomycetota bacterium]
MRVVIIGGVAGGMSAATRLRRLDPEAEIIVFEKSGHVSYANCGLPYYVGGVIENESDLLLQTPESLHKRFRLDVRVSTEVLAINAAAHTLTLKNLHSSETSEMSYDKLILSPGANPVVPPIPGVERALTLRNIEDVERIAGAVATKPKNAVVIGGGFIGVEIAENLVHKKIPTVVIEAAPQVLAPLDPEMATFVAEEITKHGIDLRLGSGVASISESSVTLSDGSVLPADLIILSIGVKPEIGLAKAAGLDITSRGAVAVNDFNQTSDLDIYAIGDAAEKKDALDGASTLVPLANLANRHGRTVADHICGLPVRVVPAQTTAIVKVFDLAVATTGWNEKRLKAADIKYLAIHTHPNSHAGYYPDSKQMSLKLLVDPNSGKIFGAQGVGTDGVDKRIDVIATAMRGGITAPELADLELAYAPPYGSAKDPVNMLGYVAENLISGLTQSVQWSAVEQMHKDGWSIVDVRSAGEFANGTIPGAINISVDEMREKIADVPTGKVIVTCQVGQRGHVATTLLRKLGYEAVNLDGGYRTWKNSPAFNSTKVKE